MPRLRRIEAAGPEEPPGSAHVAAQGRGDEAAQLDGLPGVAEPRHGGDGVEEQRGAGAGQQRGEHPEDVHHAVPGVAHDGVEEHHGDGPLGFGGGQLGDEAAAHGVAHQHGGPHPEVVEDPAEQRGVARHALGAGGEPQGAAVTGGVHGDHLEAEVHEPRERLGVEDPLGREAVHHHEGHAPTAHRHAHGVAVGQRDLVPGQPGQGDMDLFVDGRGRAR